MYRARIAFFSTCTAGLFTALACDPPDASERSADRDAARAEAFVAPSPQDRAAGIGDAADFDFANAPHLEGTLQKHIADFIDGDRSETYYGIEVHGEFVRLDTAAPPTAELGSTIRVHGELAATAPGEDKRFVVESLEMLAAPPAPIIDPEPFEPRRVAFIMIHFGTPDTMTVDEAESRLFTGPTSLNAYYNEVSFGKEQFEGDVFGWFQISKGTGCNYNSWATSARSAAQAAGANLNSYEQFLYYFPQTDDCAWGGLGQVGSPQNPARDTWYNGFADCVVLVQEPGHNFGMQHSRSWECGSVPLANNCSAFEYGNVVCPIGFGPCGHMTAYQKKFMGYFDQCNFVQTATSGRYNLQRTESPCNGIQGLRFPRGNGQNYILDYRQPLGFDGPGTPGKTGKTNRDWWPDGLTGVMVTVDAGNSGHFMLDMTPGSRDPGTSAHYNLDHLDGLLHAGESFEDPNGSVTIRVISESASHAVIELDFASDGAAPTCLNDQAPPMLDGAYGILQCEGDEPDNVPPTVSITAPADGSVFPAGSTVPVTATAADDVGVTSVDLAVDGTVQQSDTSAPYEWNLAGLGAGTYLLTAVAHDTTNATTSVPVSIIIEDGPDPSTSTTDPSTSTTDPSTSTTDPSTSTTDPSTSSTTDSSTSSSTTDSSTTDPSTSTTDTSTTDGTTSSTTDATTSGTSSTTSTSDGSTSTGPGTTSVGTSTTVGVDSMTYSSSTTLGATGGDGGVDPDGCGCTASRSTPASTALMLLGMLGLATRRRRTA